MWLAVAIACAPGELRLGLQPLDRGPEPAQLADLDPDPAVFEGELTAGPADWSTGVETVHGLAYNGQVPGPVIRVALGTRVIVHFRSALDEHTTIHWHGIEGNNAADGTATTQPALANGDVFTYDFVVTRPGHYWYHPHAHGAQGVFEGLYGVLIVEEPAEAELVAEGLLPTDERIWVLSDISTFDGDPWSVEVDNAMEIMNGTEGRALLVNGQEDPVFEVPAGGAVRLRIQNNSITRFWRLSIPGVTLYRVGGEGGLLDAVRVDGGEVTGERFRPSTGESLGPTTVDLGFPRGELVLAPAERADVVLVAAGVPGDELAVRWEDFARGRHTMWVEGDEMFMGDAEDDGERPGEQVATLRLVEAPAESWSGGEGSPLLAATGRAVPVLDGAGALDWTGDLAMVLSEEMGMYQDELGVWQMTTAMFVDGAEWMADHAAGPDQPEAPTARHAVLGQTVDWELRNDSMMWHPVHLHGFSYQVLEVEVRDEEADEAVRWTPGFAEFEDTTLLPAHGSVRVRMFLDDPVGNGGGAGRWMRHCHILQHGENGMMSELVVAAE